MNSSDTQPSPETTPPPPALPEPRAWEELGLSEDLLALIREAGFTKPTPVQNASIEDGVAGLDLIVSAQTGSGKTAAFAFPLIERLRGREGTYGLVLAPTREIAQQTQAVMEKFGAPLGVRSICLIGGIDMRLDAKAIATYPQVIVATPGRLVDHLERGNVWLDYIETVVLDEADKMLDMGFADQLNAILDQTPTSRQTLLFSATFPPSVERLAKKILYEPKRISIGRAVSPAKSVEQWAIFTEEGRKLGELMNLLREEKGSIFVFTRSKEGASRVYRSIHSAGFFDCVCLHSDLRQSDREKSLERFKSGEARILIATDVVGRGIHVDGVAMVINYDLPQDPSDYVHRIGRTGRAGESGKAASLVTSRDRMGLRGIEEILGAELPSRGRHSREDTLSGGRGGDGDRGGNRGSSRGGRGGRGGDRGGDRGGRSGGGGGGGGYRPENASPSPVAPRSAPIVGAAPVVNAAPMSSESSEDRSLGFLPEGAPQGSHSNEPSEAREGGKRRRRRGGRGRRGAGGGAPANAGVQAQASSPTVRRPEASAPQSATVPDTRRSQERGPRGNGGYGGGGSSGGGPAFPVD